MHDTPLLYFVFEMGKRGGGGGGAVETSLRRFYVGRWIKCVDRWPVVLRCEYVCVLKLKNDREKEEIKRERESL